MKKPYRSLRDRRLTTKSHTDSFPHVPATAIRLVRVVPFKDEMSTKKLSFKGDAPRKRKRAAVPKSSVDSTSLSAVPATSKVSAKSKDDEGWLDAETLEDINGPIMVAYRFDDAVSLVSDIRGSVFTIHIDPVPKLLSDATPHDVRQVYVASPILSRPVGVVSLKNGATGKYLGTDRFGDVRCEKDAISPAEEWTMVKRPDGWSIQSAFDSFLSISKTGVRGDAQEIGFCETFKIRIQAQNRSKKAKTSIAGASSMTLTTKKELEDKCDRKLDLEELEKLRTAERNGELGEAILDMRVKGRSDKFG